MRRYRLLLTLLCPLLLPPLARASGIPVFDAALNTLGLQQQFIQLQALYLRFAHF